MNFYEYMGRKLRFLLKNKTLTYVSTEGEHALSKMRREQEVKKKRIGKMRGANKYK